MLPNPTRFISFRTGVFVEDLRYINVSLRSYTTCLFNDAVNISVYLKRRNIRSIIRKNWERMMNDAVVF